MSYNLDDIREVIMYICIYMGIDIHVYTYINAYEYI
jgi:hypothetical protein